jgi:hypothetical protein
MINERILYILLNDEEVEDKDNGTDDNKTDETKTGEKEIKEPAKKITTKKDKEKSVTISQKEFKEYNDLKRANMSAEEREKALLQDIENLNLKIETYESTIQEQTNEINTMKAQEGIKTKISKIEEEKPYLKEALNKRKEKGFNSVDEVDEFIKYVDSDVLKEAYETNKKIEKATKITGNTRTGVPNNNVNYKLKTSNLDDVDLSKYGL